MEKFFFVTDMVRLFTQKSSMPKEWNVQIVSPRVLRFGQHFGDALLHFRGGFIGEGNRG